MDIRASENPGSIAKPLERERERERERDAEFVDLEKEY